ncbi:MAG: GNAT family N-acetyltransferase [Thermoanaerobaculia bacterium]|nr:GNAT family N-acetyltransferase [Thermoanaerobaculia bacterium]
MSFDYRTGAPPADAYLALFETTGWNASYGASAEELERANRQSWHAVSAWDGERLCGFGRVVSDGVLHAMIYDMIVDPRYQRCGVGSRILSMLLTRCREEGIRDVQLFCARGKKGFYLRHGFVERATDAPGMQLSLSPE